MTDLDRSSRTLPAVLAGDVVRVLVALSIVPATVAYGAVGAALVSLVLLGAVVPRALGLHGAGDPALGLVLSAAAWAGLLDLYETVPWLDLVMHLVGTAALAALAWLVLRRCGAVGPAPRRDLAAPEDEGQGVGRAADPVSLARPRLGVVVTTTALGALLALLWEVGEWAGFAYVDDSITVGYTDTVSDMAAGTVGALGAGLVLARRP